MKKAWIILLLLSSNAMAGAFGLEGQLDYQQSYRLIDESVNHQKLFLTAKSKLNYKAWTLWAELRGSDELKTIDPRTLSVAYETGPVRLEAGYQQIAWGETFGFQVADLVNPRDYSDPLLTETGWVRKAVPLVQSQIIWSSWTLQLLLIPFPRQNTYQQQGLDLSQGADSMEYGVKINRLFRSGLDVSLLYLRHWNRNPVFQLNRPVTERVHSFGVTGSFAVDSFVVRSDVVTHLDQPEQGETILTHTLATRMQAIVGADYTHGEGGLAGLQYHLDHLGAGSLHWVGARVQESFWKRKVEPEVFFFKGINNDDVWLQPKLTWYPSNALSLSVRGDFVVSSPDLRKTALPFLNEEDRIQVWGTLRF